MAQTTTPDAPSQPIERLLDDARQGSSAALGRLFESARTYLLFLANKELPPDLRAKMGASDLVQETAVDVHHDFPRFTGTTAEEFYGWLRSILRNNVLDAVRRYESSQKRAVHRETSLTALLDRDGSARCIPTTPAEKPADGSVIRREDAAQMAAVLACLPDDYRIVLRMRYWDGLTFQQIGDRFGRSPEAARKLWYRAVQKLQAEMRPSFDATRYPGQRP
jgi:RNA polymerase sigma-70 factor (ECF subfamily)